MAKKKLRVLQVLVGAADRMDATTRKSRDALFTSLLEEAKRAKCRVLLLPAGFWSVPSPKALKNLISVVSQTADQKGIIVVGGADIVTPSDGKRVAKGNGGRSKAGTKTDTLNYWGFVLGVKDGPKLWKQQSSRVKNATANNAITLTERTLTIGGRLVLVMLCGEVHGRFNRANVLAAKTQGSAFDLVLNPSHTGAGGSVLKGIRSMAAAAGAPALRAEHREVRGGAFQRVTALGEGDQVDISNEHVVSNVPWAVVCSFEVQ
jgi:hypothetical protein